MRQAFKREEGRGFRVGEKHEAGGGGGGQGGGKVGPIPLFPFTGYLAHGFI